ncbi:MAG: MarC family protein [Chthoniobacterales bacterium]
MSPLLIKISKDFATIWTTVDPISNVALFAGLTAALTRAERRSVALRASIYAVLILVVSVVAGQFILDAIGIHLHSLKVAGGIILFLFGLQICGDWQARRLLCNALGGEFGDSESGRAAADRSAFQISSLSEKMPRLLHSECQKLISDPYFDPQSALPATSLGIFERW